MEFLILPFWAHTICIVTVLFTYLLQELPFCLPILFCPFSYLLQNFSYLLQGPNIGKSGYIGKFCLPFYLPLYLPIYLSIFRSTRSSGQGPVVCTGQQWSTVVSSLTCEKFCNSCNDYVFCISLKDVFHVTSQHVRVMSATHFFGVFFKP